MRLHHTRDILFFDCKIKTLPEDATKKTFSQIVSAISQARADSKAVWWSRKRDRKMFIREQKVLNNGNAALLLYAVDSNASGASFSDLKTDAQRDEAPKPGEGRPESSHIVCIDREPRGIILVEWGSSFPRERIESYFNNLLDLHTKQFPKEWVERHPDGSLNADGMPKMRSYSNKIELRGLLSTEFEDALTSGRLRGISLETEQKTNIGFGEGSYLKPHRRSVALTPVGSWAENAGSRLKEAIGMAKKNNYEHVRVSFQSADGASHAALLEASTGSPFQEGFVRRSRLTGFNPALPEAVQEIDDAFATRMSNLL